MEEVATCGDAAAARECGPAGVLLRAGELAAPAVEDLDRAATRLARLGEPVGEPVRAARQLTLKAARKAGSGQPCPAADMLAEADSQLDAAERELRGAIAASVAVAARAPAGGDVRDEDLDLALLRVDAQQAGRWFDGARALAAAVRGGCAALEGEMRVRGAITQVHGRVIRIDDGPPIALPESIHGVPLFEGAQIDVRAARFSGGNILFARKVRLVAEVAKEKVEIRCLQPRIAPVQPLELGQPAAIVHPIDGYRGEDALILERGMGITLAAGTCPTEDPENPLVKFRYRAEVTVSGLPVVTMGAGDPPLILDDPDWEPTHSDFITIDVYRLACVFGDDCAITHLSQDHHPFQSRPLGSVGRVKYSTTSVGIVDDGSIAGDHEVVEVLEWGFNRPGLGPATFVGEGYAAAADGTSSAPQVATIVNDQPFAIHEHDFLPPFSPLGARDRHRLYGQQQRSGLRWARVEGSADGAPVSYSVATPHVSRDAVNRCPTVPGFWLNRGPMNPDKPGERFPPTEPGGFYVGDSPDSFYKLPYLAPWSAGFGYLNIDDGQVHRRHPSHQAYALDLGAPHGTPVLAARGGRVHSIEERDHWQRAEGLPAPPEDWPYFGNYVIVEHEDGSFGVYYHFAHQAVHVAPGQLIARGAVLGETGQTGSATGPHVHFGVHDFPDADWEAVRASYEVLRRDAADQFYVSECQIPRAGDEIYSSNAGA